MTKKSDIYFTPEDSPVRPNPFDTRVRLRNLTRGDITQEGVQKFLNGLPDETSHAEIRGYTDVIYEESNESNGSAPDSTTH